MCMIVPTTFSWFVTIFTLNFCLIKASPKALMETRLWTRSALGLRSDSLQLPRKFELERPLKILTANSRLIWIGREGSRSRRLKEGGKNGRLFKFRASREMWSCSSSRLMKAIETQFPLLDVEWVSTFVFVNGWMISAVKLTPGLESAANTLTTELKMVLCPLPVSVE